MTKIIVYIISSFICANGYCQDADHFEIQIKDTLNNHIESVLNIHILRKDKERFRFPENSLIGLESNINSDLMMRVEKLDSSGEFHEYYCKGNGVHYDGLNFNKPRYKTYKKVYLIDSLNSFYCLEKGSYRIRILYNKRKSTGEEVFPKIVAKSNWARFYVAKDIVLNRYWLNN